MVVVVVVVVVVVAVVVVVVVAAAASTPTAVQKKTRQSNNTTQSKITAHSKHCNERKRWTATSTGKGEMLFHPWLCIATRARTK